MSGAVNSSLGNVEIKVSTDVMKNQADEVKRLTDRVKTHFEEIGKNVKNMSSYWKGEAHELHEDLYEGKKDDIEIMLRRLYEHANDLLLISGNYEVAESSNVSTAAVLEEDIIS